ncbi:MAG: GNAT family N-acetyltransferase, partial [Enterobacterales bacterium]|nr:GNAT family N-acetyltransferase [Enterobacterales bacterium]
MIDIKVLKSIDQSRPQDWQDWLPENAVFNRYEVLHAMETSGCTSPETGWQPQHLQLSSGDETLGLLPLYQKNHSYGEYMFDWQWANGFHRAGIAYYPKAVAAIPFTPVTGPRLISKDNIELQSEIISHVSDLNISNFQCLYVTKEEADAWQATGAQIRRGYQFSWYNHDYTTFDDFLGDLRSKVRKNIRRERRQMAESNLKFQTYRGEQITPDLWRFFLLCYQRTYLKRSGHEGYLNKGFYDAILSSLNDNLLLIVAE